MLLFSYAFFKLQTLTNYIQGKTTHSSADLFKMVQYYYSNTHIRKSSHLVLKQWTKLLHYCYLILNFKHRYLLIYFSCMPLVKQAKRIHQFRDNTNICNRRCTSQQLIFKQYSLRQRHRSLRQVWSLDACLEWLFYQQWAAFKVLWHFTVQCYFLVS